MPAQKLQGRLFDARPDRVDYRDRPYNPPLVCLPEHYPDEATVSTHLPEYTKGHKLVLNQGSEGACTGFGLAAVINYLLYLQHLEREKETGKKLASMETVSPRMLYQMARIYDEWPGEDYEGSSCRGAMKGWHRHGVCTETLWPYGSRFVQPKKGWQQVAARHPLGAYYRVNKDSVADMQAAIFEVGAIYVSAQVHQGWFLGTESQLPVIRLTRGETGGHAFAMIGYTPEGFIVQNSWGPKWGFNGFAILTYEDWVQNGGDAWTAVLGAPVLVTGAPRTISSMSLRAVASGKAEWSWHSGSTASPFPYENPGVKPLDEGTAYTRTVVMGNDGRPMNRFLDRETGDDAVKEVAYDLPLAWLRSRRKTRLAIYAHGGLNDEEASLKRIRVMAPYFLENDIYPLFVTWRTGFGESLSSILEDAVGKFFKPSEEFPSRGWLDDAMRRLKDARDRSVELACERLLVKPVWMQMKQNAEAAAVAGSGLALLAGHLDELRQALPSLEIHLVGHSAGSIVHGHLLHLLGRKSQPVQSVSLYAPACTVPFALHHYRAAIEDKQILAKDRLYVDLMSDEREKADSVGPYGKSLLYLVSRALESYHKMPLLGMEAAWDAKVENRGENDLWHKEGNKAVDKWREFASGAIPVTVHSKESTERGKVFDGQGLIPLAHGSFDNDVNVVTATLERIRGSKVKAKVETLRGF